jgi:hypothetical protein
MSRATNDMGSSTDDLKQTAGQVGRNVREAGEQVK